MLYVPQRVGFNGREFNQLKFRTMHNDADSQLAAALDVDAPPGRVTRPGKLLRRSSLDELPQLLNVLRGDMAIVGPRPLLPEVADRIPPDHARFSVLPGLTGLAQISGRNTLPWTERLRLDAEYATRRTLRLDLEILVRSVSVVLRSDGFVQDRNASDVMDL